MKTYRMICPFCGQSNDHLYLEETRGSMECLHCRQVTVFPGYGQLLPEVRTQNRAPVPSLPGKIDALSGEACC